MTSEERLLEIIGENKLLEAVAQQVSWHAILEWAEAAFLVRSGRATVKIYIRVVGLYSTITFSNALDPNFDDLFERVYYEEEFEDLLIRAIQESL